MDIASLVNAVHGNSNDPQICLQVELEINNILATKGPAGLLRLDRELRLLSGYSRRQIKTNEVKALGRGSAACLGILAGNPSGCVREAAVHALAVIDSGSELPFLLIRLNDWVRPVRDAARDAVFERMVPVYAMRFARCLPLVMQIQQQGRDDHQQIVNAILTLLKQPASIAALESATEAPDRATPRLAYRLLADIDGIDLAGVIQNALLSHDAVVRLWAAKLAVEQLPPVQLHPLLDQLLADSFMPIRFAALNACEERFPIDAGVRLEYALLDQNVLMRETARLYLARRGYRDFAEFYRTHCRLDEAPAHLSAALAGLGETGRPEDIEFAFPYLDHEHTRVRAAAVRALVRLIDDFPADLLQRFLVDDRSRVAKVALQVFRARPWMLSTQWLWSTLESETRARVRLRLLDLIAQLTWWDSITLLLRTGALGDEGLRSRAEEHVRLWSKKGGGYSVKPTPAQLAELDAAIAAHANQFDSALMADLRDGVAWTRRNLG